MKQIIWLLIVLVTAQSCSKGWEDIEIGGNACKNVVRVSERYTIEWRKIGEVRTELGEYCGHNLEDIQKVKPDTTISSCSIDKVDSLFRIEIRKYVVK